MKPASPEMHNGDMTLIGNRVRVLTNDGFPSSGSVVGNLHKLDAAGALVYRTDGMPEQQGAIFIPMMRIREIVDLGRAQ